jgi:phage terminase large subunit-like protein
MAGQPIARERKDKAEYLALLEEKSRRIKDRLFLTTFETSYPWQRDFVAATATFHESCLCAANQIGKTRTGTMIDAAHLMGDYPDDWDGHRFDFAPMCWGLGFSMEKTRDLLQKALFGVIEGGRFTGGLVPADRIISYQSASGTPGAARTVWVKHQAGTSIMQFWSYSQGQHAIMGDVVDWVHVDEEPTDQSIRPQLLTRTINGDNGRGGRIIYTFTPENGRTELVVQFMDTPSPAQFWMMKGWDDAPHITQEMRERLIQQIPEHQRDMRTKGLPMLGHGRIYDIADEFITCDPIYDIPPHWWVIHGMDFGYDHPQAHVRLYEDRDNDIIYLAKAYKASRLSANEAWGQIKDWGRAPTAWPHDGLQHEKGRDDAAQLKDLYVRAGFSMLPSHATWPAINGQPGGNSVEKGLLEISERMRLGKFKVFRGLMDFFAEMRQYHRDDKGKIVKVNDDILDAVRYAYMMRRYATQVGASTNPVNRADFMPLPIRSIGRR